MQIQSPDEVLALLTRLTSRPGCPRAGVLVSIATKPGEPRRLIAGRALYCASPTAARPPREYPTVGLYEAWIPAGQFLAWLQQAMLGTIRINDRQVATQFDCAQARRNTRAQWSLSGWSEDIVSCIMQQHGVALDMGIVARSGCPPCTSADIAADDWVFQGEEPSREQGLRHDRELLVICPDVRGRIVEAVWNAGTLSIDSEIRADATVELQLQFVGSRIEPHRLLKPEARLSVAVPLDAQKVRAYLVTGWDLLYDLELTRARPAFGPSKGRVQLEMEIEADLETGEGQYIEYKPFIGSKDPKLTEVIQTVVAFANSGGGTVYIGISDWGVLQGDARLNKYSPNLEEYADSIRKTLVERIRPYAPSEVQAVLYKGHPLVVIEVPEFKRGAFWTDGNAVMVRKGASNRMADPGTELLNLLDHS